MERVKGDLRGIDFGHVAGVLAMAADVKGHGRVAAPGLQIVRSFDWLRFSRKGMRERPPAKPYALPAPVPGRVAVPGSGIVISLELLDKPETSEASEYVYNSNMSCIDWPRVSGPLELRSWRPGDRYQPAGHAGEEKIKKLFQKARIPLWERGAWPVLSDRSGIVWALRFGPAASLHPGAAAGTVLRIRETVKVESETLAGASIQMG
jgi:tRNA(Ile)-lysidine synthase